MLKPRTSTVARARRDPATRGATHSSAITITRVRGPLPGARLVPGLLLALGAAGASVLIAGLVPALSPLLVAILLGALLANLTSVGRQMPAVLAPGMQVASKRLLRLGIVLLGMQLVLTDILGLGWTVLAGVVTVVGVGIGATVWLGRRWNLDPTLTLLVACGFSICGAAAIAGVDGVLTRRRAQQTATAIALVVIFGSSMILLMPLLASALGLDQRTAGVWVGASVHEVAQVVAAGAIIGTAAMKVAVIVKLARVLMLAPVLAVVSWQQRKLAVADAAQAGESADQPKATTKPPLVPLFVVGFLAMVVLRSTGVVPTELLAPIKLVQTLLLAAAMFALGCSVHWSVLRQAGGKVVALAATATVLVTGLGLATALLSA